MTTAWIIIPTYQEAENLLPLVSAVREALARGAAGVRCTLLIVDDASPDGTGLIADSLARRHPDVQVLHRPQKAGLAGAYVAGFRRALDAGADHVIEMDADFSHDPADVPRLLAEALAGSDVVLGSRYVAGGATPGWTRRRRWLSVAGGTYARTVLGLPYRDLTGGFKCLSATALRAIGLETLTAKGYAFQIETTFRAARAGLRITEIPIAFGERRHGSSKMSPAIAAEALWRMPLIRAATELDARRPATPARRHRPVGP